MIAAYVLEERHDDGVGTRISALIIKDQLHGSLFEGYGGGRSDDGRSVVVERQDRLAAIADHFFGALVVDKNTRLKLNLLSSHTNRPND